ncbi:MAG: AraC family transcriptional regulator [Polyangiaceae bacterium]
MARPLRVPGFARSPSVGIFLARAMLAHAAAGGLDPQALIDHFGLSRAALADVDGRMPAETAVRMWSELPDLTNDPAFGLHLGVALGNAANLGVAGHLLLASHSLRDGLKRLARVERVFNDVRRSTVREDEGGIHYSIATRDDPMPVPAQGIECMMVFFVLLERRATNADIRPTRVAVEHARSPRAAEFERLLWGANSSQRVEFDAQENAMSFSPVDADRPHLTAGADLVVILERHAEEIIARLPRFDDDLADVRKAISTELARGETAIGEVARKLGTSARSLQRRLESEGTTYQVLLDEVRYAAAARYLEDPLVSIAEAAMALGFADQSAFTKAFLRWSGTSPGAYRKTSAARV